MGRGAKPGERRGGRQRGTKNKRTLERERLAAQLLQDTPPELLESAASKLGKDILSFWANEFDRLAQYFREGKHADTTLCRQYAEAACAIAARLAPFESPTYRAVLLQPAPSQENRRFTLRIHDHRESA